MNGLILAFLALAAPAAAQEVEVQRQGSPPARKGPAETFVGSVWLEGPFRGRGDARVGGATVSFEPGARTAWHSHPLGQTLIVTRGCGLVQGEGSPPMAIRPGDVVWIPAGKPHWHGAAPSSSMSHVAISESLDGRSVTWMKHVEQQAYSDAARGSPC